VAWLGVLASASGAGATTSLNLSSALADTKAKLQSEQVANIMVIGDSLSLRDGSYLPYFEQLMKSRYGDAGAGYQAYSFWTGGGFDLGWTFGFVNADTPPHYGLDGMWASSSSAPWPPNHTGGFLNARSSTVQVHYVAKPGGGSFRVDPVSVGTVATLNCDSPVNEVRTFEYTFNGTFPRIWFQPLGNGQIVILGQNNIIQGASGVRIHRAANGGWGVGNFLQRNWTFDQQVGLVEPDLIMIWLGQNDGALYNRTTYAIALNNLVNRLNASAPSAEVVLIGTYNSGVPQLANLVGAMQDVATARGIGFINLYEAAGDYQFFIDNPYLDDGVHFTHAGGRYLGRVLFNAFESDGKTLNLPPTPHCAADTNLDNRVDGADLSVLLTQFGNTALPPFTGADFNGDRRVDGADLSILLSTFGCAGP